MSEKTDVAKRHQLGDTVWRWWYHKNPERIWYEPYDVEKVTDKQVWVRGFMEDHCIILKRGLLERTGSCTSSRHHAIFYVERPKVYERRTIGYLMDLKPREVLGLLEDFTEEDLKAAYRRKALQHHPDRGGDPDEYKNVHDAYEALIKEPSIGAILKFADQFRSEKNADTI